MTDQEYIRMRLSEGAVIVRSTTGSHPSLDRLVSRFTFRRHLGDRRHRRAVRGW